MRMEEARSDAAGIPPAGNTLEVGGRFILVDDGGYLLYPSDWSKDVAITMAQADGVELVDDHWLLIDFLNRFYDEYEVPPTLAVLSRNLCKDQHNCRWTRKYIKELFPGGANWACRYAGLPKPTTNCV